MMTHQLESLNIHAFRQLKHVELRDLGRVNLLVGVNNSGKTSVLEAIAAHCRPLDPLEWIALARQREVKSSREPALDAVRWLFPQQGAEPEDPYYRGQVHIEGSGSYPNLDTCARYEGMIAASDDDTGPNGADGEDDEEDSSESSASTTPPPESDERGAMISLSARVPADRWLEFEAGPDGVCHEQFRLWENKRYVSHAAPSGLQLPVATISPFAHRVRQLQVSKLSEATLTGRKFSIIEVVRLIDPDVEDLEILSRTGIRPTLYVRHKRTGFTPLSALGDGVRRVMTIALNLGSVQHGALLVDEIETAIHKDALTAVFQWLVRACKYFEVQLFATTHSLEAIDALLTAQIDDPEELVVFHLPESEEGTIKRFEGDVLDNLRFERGLDIR
jgi:hypothetical protein